MHFKPAKIYGYIFMIVSSFHDLIDFSKDLGAGIKTAELIS